MAQAGHPQHLSGSALILPEFRDMAISFRRLSEAELRKPLVNPMTEEERLLMSRAMGQPPSRSRLLEKHLTLSMPNIEACHDYIEWYEAQGFEDGFALMIEADWRINFGEQAMQSMVNSMHLLGKPTVHWVFTYSFAEETPRGLIATAASAA